MATKDEDFVTRLFVANTHTPMLFFSSRGIAYKMKVWRLPLGGPTARGKALVNMLPLEAGEQITSIMPLPEDEETWGNLDVMFATRRGTVRRNKLSDFTQINKNGKIAMKLEEGDGIVGVFTCTEHDDVMLTTALGQCIRFSVTDVRVFAGRNSVGVRGIALAEGDEVISISILGHLDCTADERTAYLRWRRLMRGEGDEAAANGDAAAGDEEAEGEGELTPERYAMMSAAEQVILTLSQNGFGKRSSSFEYRVTGRGGKGITAMAVTKRNGPLVASFPVEENDQIMLVTNGGQLIRCPVDGIRIAGRATQGVIVFNTAEGEEVVSVSRVSEDDGEEDGLEAGGAPEAGDGAAAPSPDEGEGEGGEG
jgi:DNA gyrase subunit A